MKRKHFSSRNFFHVITTSYDVITSRCGPQRSHLCRYYLFSKSYCHNFYTCKVMEGGRNPTLAAPHPPPPPSFPQKTKHKSGLHQRQKGWNEFAFAMFPHSSDSKTVRVNERYPLFAPTPLTMLSPGNENELCI